MVQKLLDKQYLITSYIESRLQIVNFIVDGYNNNTSVLMDNRFLHFSAHIYYRNIIVDLVALFSEGQNHKQSFYRIINNNNIVKPDTRSDIQTWLSDKKSEIDRIKLLRNKEIAHFEFSYTEVISMNFDDLQIINDLSDLAKRIITKISSSFFNTEYLFDTDNDFIDSLESLIEAG